MVANPFNLKRAMTPPRVSIFMDRVKPPYYQWQAITDLHRWADALETSENGEWLDEEDFRAISAILRKICGSLVLRKAIFAGLQKQGRPSAEEGRDRLIALEYFLRRQLNGRGWSKKDIYYTARSWTEWGVTEATVRTIKKNKKYREYSFDKIKRQLGSREAKKRGYSGEQVLLCMLKGVDSARKASEKSVKFVKKEAG